VRSTEDGRILWTKPCSGLSGWREWLLLEGEQLFVLDPKTGDVVRSIGVTQKLERPGSVCGSLVVYASSESHVFAVNVEKGQMEWDRLLLDEVAARTSTEPSPGTVRIGPGSLPGRFVLNHERSTSSCSLEDGSIQWQIPFWACDCLPARAGGRVYVLDGNRLLAVDERDGQILYDVVHPELERDWAFFQKEGTIYRDRLAVAHQYGRLSIFNLTDGSLIGIHKEKVSLWRTAEVDGRLLVGTDDGTLLVFDESVWGL
jgi:outer membrane protein assembly factor BamB